MLTLYQVNLGGQTNEIKGNAESISVRQPEKRRALGAPGVGWRILLKRILKKYYVRVLILQGQDKVQFWAVLKRQLTLNFHKKQDIS
jgi:hypothetical protein